MEQIVSKLLSKTSHKRILLYSLDYIGRDKGRVVLLQHLTNCFIPLSPVDEKRRYGLIKIKYHLSLFVFS